jgi:hypothetical protein
MAYEGTGNLRIALSTRTTGIKREMFEMFTIYKKHENLDQISLGYPSEKFFVLFSERSKVPVGNFDGFINVDIWEQMRAPTPIRILHEKSINL